MLHRQGFTLMEMIVVLIIIGVCAAFAIPNFTTPNEQAMAVNTQNNLLAIYSAQQNFRNNSGNYCINYGGNNLECYGLDTGTKPINTSLSLNIQDDGTYAYFCGVNASGIGGHCDATRTNGASQPITISVILNQPIQLKAGATHNPTCTSTTGNCSWCPLGSCG